MNFSPPEVSRAASHAFMDLVAPRSPHWHSVEKAHLKLQPFCRFCGTSENLEVHHIKPFHLFPSLELDEKNLITLCMSPGHECHLRHGHLGSWMKWNPNIVVECRALVPHHYRLGLTSDLIDRNAGWNLKATADGDDIILTELDGSNVRMTCFGGDSDPQDNGETASGFNSRANLNSPGVALPMNGLEFGTSNSDFHKALDGSPIPRLPFLWPVQVSTQFTKRVFACVDLGPAKWTGNGCDLLPAAAREFDPHASAINFSMRMEVRILNAARFLKTVARDSSPCSIPLQGRDALATTL